MKYMEKRMIVDGAMYRRRKSTWKEDLICFILTLLSIAAVVQAGILLETQ